MESLGGKCGVKDPVSGARGSCFWFAIPYKPNDTISSQKSLSDEGTTDSVRVDLNRCVNNELEKSLDDEQSAIVAQFISQQTLSSDSEVTSTLSTNRFSLRVLLVDDSGLIRKGMSRSLAKDGHQVQVAQHGAEAVKILTASRAASETGEFGFDLILMDLQMPVMDGLEATKRIREMESHASSENGGKESSRIMIVGISANTAGEVKHDCLECGMDGFMEKPVRMKHIREFFSLYSSRTSQKSASNM
jgi:CheY-like chemotaxis protein